jgi:hypothetical protein
MKNTCLVPPHGIETPLIAPSHGTRKTRTVPPHGTMRPLFGFFSVPSHGHHLELCHLWGPVLAVLLSDDCLKPERPSVEKKGVDRKQKAEVKS